MRVITIEVVILVPKTIWSEKLRERIGSLIAEDISADEALLDVSVTAVRNAKLDDFPEAG
jgi:hypothetical protein